MKKNNKKLAERIFKICEALGDGYQCEDFKISLTNKNLVFKAYSIQQFNDRHLIRVYKYFETGKFCIERMY